jgi:hypothetical protein
MRNCDMFCVQNHILCSSFDCHHHVRLWSVHVLFVPTLSSGLSVIEERRYSSYSFLTLALDGGEQ